MKNEKSERKFDFRPMGLAIKKAREKKGMTQEQLADIIGRDTRTVMYHENDGQHPSLDIFYQLATMFDLSVDELCKAWQLIFQFTNIFILQKEKSGSTANRTNRKAVLPFCVTESV